MDHEELSPMMPYKSSHKQPSLQHSSENSTMATHTQHMDMQARGSRLLTSPNLSEANMNLVMTLGLEEVYKRMAENHKFHIDTVRRVAVSQQCLEDVDQVLFRMRNAAEHEYVRLMEQESDEEEEDAKDLHGCLVQEGRESKGKGKGRARESKREGTLEQGKE